MTAVTYLVDTDLVIHHFKGNSKITMRLEELQPRGLGLSVVSLAELWEGIIYSRDPADGAQRLTKFLTGVEILPLNETICKKFGELRGGQRKAGRPIADFDLLIAATALEQDLTLLSNNRKHFEHIPGLQLETLGL